MSDVYREAVTHYATLEVAAPFRLRTWLENVAHNERAQALIRRGLRRIASWNATDAVDDTLGELRATVNTLKFNSDTRQNERTLAVFKARGAEDTPVSMGGFGMIVTHLGNVLISIQPKGKSYQPQFGGKLGLTIWPLEKPPTKGRIQLGKYTYSLARYDQPTRLQEALKLAADAFMRAGGDLDLFYEAVGETGQCAICGRSLTDPLSKARGIGPECIKTIYAGVFMGMLDEARAEAVRKARQGRFL